METLSIIVIDELSNELVASEGWNSGDPVSCSWSTYTGDTFVRSSEHDKVDVFFSREAAQAEIDSRSSTFVGVTFKVVTYIRLQETRARS